MGCVGPKHESLFLFKKSWGCLWGLLFFAPGVSRVSARWATYYLLALLKESKQRNFFVLLWRWVYFAPVTSRVSARQPSYFLLLRQKKVTKEKASHVRAASRCLALLAAFGTLANSLRSDNASVLIRTLLRCSARPNGGGIPHGSSASRTSPERLVRCAHLAECWVASFLYPHFSQGHGTPCHYASFLTPHFASWATTRVAPTTSFLTPHSSLLRPHSSLLRPHSSLLTPHSSLLTPHSSPSAIPIAAAAASVR